MFLGTGAFKNILGNKYPILVMLLCLCVNSWAGCYATQQYADGPNQGDAGTACGPDRGQMCSECGLCGNGCGPVRYWTGSQYLYLSGGSIAPITQQFCSGTSNSTCSRNASCWYSQACSTQEEADSLACVTAGNTWQNGECEEPPKDSVTICQSEYLCEEGTGGCVMQMYLFKCADSNLSSENCRPMMSVPGTCSQNGYQEGEQPPQGPQGPDCFASFDGTCYMMDKATGNTFNCDCTDNSCNDAYNRLADGRCKNPYSSPSSSASSSGSSSPSSSDSPSSSGSGDRPPESIPSQGEDHDGDWEYDYSLVLNAINNNVIDVSNAVRDGNSELSNIRANTQNIASNTQYTNSILNQVIAPSISNAGSTVSDAVREENAKLIQQWNNKWGDVQNINTGIDSLVTLLSRSSASTPPPSSSSSVNSSSSASVPDIPSSMAYDTSKIHMVNDFMENVKSNFWNQNQMDSVKYWIDSINARVHDSDFNQVNIYPDSLLIDSTVIKRKFSSLYTNIPTSNTCFILDVNLGRFGGLAKQDLRIYIDFSNFGGYDFCNIERIMVKIITLIVCIVLTISSWRSAFGGGD